MTVSGTFRATLPAADIDRARTWYREVLGLIPVETDEFGSSTYVAGSTEFLLFPSAFAGTNEATAMGFVAEDFDGAIARLRERGIALQDVDLGEVATVDGVLTAPDGRKVAWCSDSEGNVLAISNS